MQTFDSEIDSKATLPGIDCSFEFQYTHFSMKWKHFKPKYV